MGEISIIGLDLAKQFFRFMAHALTVALFCVRN